jgi:crotonobetainyl-CoA:carnitine CoA-transferase CaiB-like acyl-CoA transferase
LTVTYDHPLFGEMVRTAPPITFSETPGVVGPPCMRGQHNRAILTELGYTAEQIDDYEARSIIRPPDQT